MIEYNKQKSHNRMRTCTCIYAATMSQGLVQLPLVGTRKYWFATVYYVGTYNMLLKKIMMSLYNLLTSQNWV